MEEDALLDRYEKLERKQENTKSDSGIVKCQRERKKIRDRLVKNHGWSQKEANGLCE